MGFIMFSSTSGFLKQMNIRHSTLIQHMVALLPHVASITSYHGTDGILFGTEVIFCRMNSQVFDALSVLKVVTSPDLDLRQLLDLQTTPTRGEITAEADITHLTSFNYIHL